MESTVQQVVTDENFIQWTASSFGVWGLLFLLKDYVITSSMMQTEKV